MFVAISLIRPTKASSRASQNVFRPLHELHEERLRELAVQEVFPLASAATSASAYIATAYTFTLMIAIFSANARAEALHLLLLQCVSYVSGKRLVAGSTTAANTARGRRGRGGRANGRAADRARAAKRRGRGAERPRRADDVAVCIVRMMTRGERTGPRRGGCGSDEGCFNNDNVLRARARF